MHSSTSFAAVFRPARMPPGMQTCIGHTLTLTFQPPHTILYPRSHFLPEWLIQCPSPLGYLVLFPYVMAHLFWSLWCLPWTPGLELEDSIFNVLWISNFAIFMHPTKSACKHSWLWLSLRSDDIAHLPPLMLWGTHQVLISNIIKNPPIKPCLQIMNQFNETYQSSPIQIEIVMRGNNSHVKVIPHMNTWYCKTKIGDIIQHDPFFPSRICAHVYHI